MSPENNLWTFFVKKRRKSKFMNARSKRIIKISALMCLILVAYKKYDASGAVISNTKISSITTYASEKVDNISSSLVSSIKEQVPTEETINSEYVVSDDLYESATLERVVDGDTIVVTFDDTGDSGKVRLIGIDTPESVSSDEDKNNEYGDMASEHTKELLADISKLYLEYDEEETDVYGRTLAYVWLTVPESVNYDTIKTDMLNAVILADGYAMNKEYEPNTKYSSAFATICDNAKEEESGLWTYSGFVALWE